MAVLHLSPTDLASITSAVSSRAGLILARYEVRGQRYTTEREIVAALAIEQGTPLLSIDLTAARARVERLPWVKSALVERVLPDSLSIEVTERRAAAVWSMPERDRLIDIEGRTLAEVARGSDVGLPVLSGEDAGPGAAGILPALASNVEIARRLVEAQRIAGRRWTLHLAGGTRVLLPADGIDAALAWLSSRPAEGLLDAGLEAIDLRVHAQLVVRHGAQAPSDTTLAATPLTRERSRP